MALRALVTISGVARGGRDADLKRFVFCRRGGRPGVASQLSKTVICASLSIYAPASCLPQIINLCFLFLPRCPRLALQEGKQTRKHLIDRGGLALATF